MTTLQITFLELYINSYKTDSSFRIASSNAGVIMKVILNILVVSGKRARGFAVGRQLLTGCDLIEQNLPCNLVKFNLESVILANNIREALEKINKNELNVILCDSTLTGWRELSRVFKRTNRHRIFALFGDDDSPDSYYHPGADLFLFSSDLRRNAQTACDKIGQSVSKRYRELRNRLLPKTY